MLKKGFVTIHHKRVKKVSEGQIDYYLVLIEKPGKMAIVASRLPFEEVQLEFPKEDKKTAHNLHYGEIIPIFKNYFLPYWQSFHTPFRGFHVVLQ